MTNPLQQPYSWTLGVYKTLKNAAVVLVPYLVAVNGLNLPGEYGAVVALVSYWVKNFADNWR